MKSLRISLHARNEALRRGIPAEVLESVVRNPQQVLPTWGDRIIHQSRIAILDKEFLIRAIITEKSGERVVVTVYRTSKIDKYWRMP
jgi:hypothetical protein